MTLTRYRRPIVIFIELTLILIANYLSFWLRFDGDVPLSYIKLFTQTLPIVVAVRAVVFVPFRLYEGLWRYTSLWDLRNIAAAVLSSTIVIHVILNGLMHRGYPRGVIIIDALLLLIFMTGVRLARRIYRELGSVQRKNGILIYGAGDAGEMVVRDMKNNPTYRMYPIGFIDDDPEKVGHSIHGVPVLGTRKDVKTIMNRTNAHEILIAMPRARANQVREILKILEPFKVPITTLPNFRDLLDGRVTVNNIRGLELDDLLQRVPIGLDPVPLHALIEGRRIVVTGAGGSIGSELCRQIVRMRPEALIMLERHEHSLYSIQKDSQMSGKVIGKIADVTDRIAIAGILQEYTPHIIFHAAAHKHVPLMEANTCEAIKNNVRGTRLLAEEAVSKGVERFILISTDKAVNPSSIMGASKRVAELIIQNMAQNGRTCFNAVRFGNVLGSSGSVVPLFLEQIRSGGPVTVTHPEMRRYFMLISEAVQLVLRAATLGDSGTIYVLDMGDEFKIVDLARNLIRLSGYIPDEEMAIAFTGLRAGERLSEVLVGVNESLEPSLVEKIHKIRSEGILEQQLLQIHLPELETAAASGRTEKVVQILREIIPTFQPAEFKTPARRARSA